jgi:formate/nitrite transporter FocA (FNT family)
MTKSTFAKTKAQIKSYQYYIFWGACTVAVMAGQIFVGAGYQSMSNSVNDLTEIIEIKIELEELRQRRTGGGIIY